MASPIGNGECSAKGFTLLELLVVLLIVGVLTSLVAPRYWGHVAHSKETVLRTNLYVIRDQIDKFYVDTGRYPESLARLVEKHYLQEIPEDPITERRDTWILVPAHEQGQDGIAGARSGAQGTASDGSRYDTW